jgi:GxxExxY protein
MTENAIATEIVDAAFRIHTTLGPGLLESVYHAVLAYELAQRGIRTVSQQPIPVVYGTIRIDIGFRADLIVEDKVIVEIKSVEILAPVHRKQLLTYLRLADKRLGLLINFNAALIKDGIARIVNGLEEESLGRVGERATPKVRPTLPSSNRTSRFPDIRLSWNPIRRRHAQAGARLLVPTNAPDQSAGFVHSN